MTTSFLLIDDDQVFRDRLAQACERRGYTVFTAASGAEALQLQIHVDRIVLDLRMPGESGLALISPLQKHFPNAAILILSGYGSIPTAVESVQRGAKNFLTKPATLDEILAAFSAAQQAAPHVPAGEMTVPSLEEAEWNHINRVLEEYGGNISQAAKALGLHRRSLQRKLGKIQN